MHGFFTPLLRDKIYGHKEIKYNTVYTNHITIWHKTNTGDAILLTNKQSLIIYHTQLSLSSLVGRASKPPPDLFSSEYGI